MVSNRTSTIIAVFIALWFSGANAASITFDDLDHGDIVTNQYNDATHGFATISAFNRHLADPNEHHAVVFDSGHLGNTEDPDLMAPFENKNDSLPVMIDGQFADAFNPGNILIIQEDTEGPGCTPTNCASPDDQGARPAGYLQFRFELPVELISLDFFDIETRDENNNEPFSEIEFLDTAGDIIPQDPQEWYVPGTGGGISNNHGPENNNTWDRLFFSGISPVYGLRVNLIGSGAIDNLVYNVVPVPASVWLFGTALLGFIGLSRRTNI